MVQFSSMDEIELGAEYRDLISGFKGIAIAKTTHITGCDRITLEQPIEKPGDKPVAFAIDVSTLVYESPGITEQMAEHTASNPNPAAPPPGGPMTRVH